MNNARRKAIREVLEKVSELRANLEGLRDEEQEYFDNMPESLQGGDKGQAAESVISEIETAISSLEESEGSMEMACE